MSLRYHQAGSHGVAAAESPPILMAGDQSWPWGFLMPDALGISRLVHEGFFHRFRVSIHHRQVGAHRAFRARAPLLPFLERARALRCLLLSPKGAIQSSPGHRPGEYGTSTTASPEGAAHAVASIPQLPFVFDRDFGRGCYWRAPSGLDLETAP